MGFGVWKATVVVGLQARLARLTLKTRAEVPMLLYVAGLGCVTYGFWSAWHPLGWIFGGASLAWTAIMYEKISVARAEAEKLEKLISPASPASPACRR